jgi:two-component system response regulator YesN
MYRVIIADDEPKVSQLIKNLIEWERLNLELVATAQDGMTALELIKEYQPDIVITDIRMPGYDGIELIRYSKELNSNIDFIIISGYQHFNYAHNAIKYGVKDYLLKPLNKNEINATLAKMIEKYSERSRQEMHCREDIKRLKNELAQGIYGGSGKLTLKEMELGRINQYYDVSFIKGCYQAFIVKPDFEYQPNNQDTMRMILGKISKIIEQNLKGICAETLWLLLEDRIYIIANYRPENKKLFRKALNSILDESHLLRDIFKELMVTISLGSVQPELAGIEGSTGEVKEAINDRMIMGGGKIIQYNSELHTEKSAEPVISFERRKKLIDFIEVFDKVGVEKWIDEIAAEILNLSNVSGKFILDTIDEIIEILLYGLKNQANVKGVDKSLFNELHEAILMQNNVRVIFELTNKYAGKILQQIADQRKNEVNRPIKEAQKYINEHYTSNISLEEVSAIIGFNATYLSTLFKKETGMNFLEYVTIARIKSAKQLLADSKKSTLDISHEVGYCDFKHFTKQFKKVTGLTPSEYRKLYY